MAERSLSIFNFKQIGAFRGLIDRSQFLLVVSCLALAGWPILLLQRIHWPLLVLGEGAILAVSLWINSRHRKLVLLFVGMGLLFLAGGEVYLRVRYFGPAGMSFDRYRPASYGHPWSRFEFSEATYTGLKPNTVVRFKGKLFSVNADGFRGKSYLRPKPAGVFRVVLLGASATQGSGLEDSEVMTEVMESRLNATGLQVRVEVVNLSLGGSRLGEMVHCLESIGMSYEPDLILVGANQVLIPTREMEIRARTVRALQVSPWRKVLDRQYAFIGSRFFFIDLLEQLRSGEIVGMGRVLARPLSSGETLEYKMPEGQQHNLETGLTRIQAAAGPVPVALYLLRPISNRQGFTDRAGFRAYLSQRAAAYGMTVLDTTDLNFEAYRELDLIVYPGDKHPNAIAHQLFAGRMSDELATVIRSRMENR